MDIRITENLKSFRREKGNKQEDLANHLSISVQAVSKWERGEGFPDITFLPQIAAYYGTTVDDLLGCSEIEKSKKIAKYTAQFDKNANVGKIKENIDLMHTALKEFPDNLELMEKLCTSLFFIDKKEYLDECIEVGERILSKSMDDQQRFVIIQTLVFAYNRINNVEKAREYAEKLPDPYCTRNAVLQSVEKGDALRKLTQGNIFQYIGLIDSSVLWMLRSKEYTPEEKIFAYETVDKLYNLFLYDGNYGMEHTGLHMLWMNIAEEYGKLCNREKTIAALKKAYYHAYELDHLEDGKYTSMFSDSGDYSKKSFTRNFEHSYVEWLKNFMNNSFFDFVRDTEEWRSIMA